MNLILVFLAIFISGIEISLLPQLNEILRFFPIAMMVSIILMHRYNDKMGSIWLIGVSLILILSITVPIYIPLLYLFSSIFSLVAMRAIFVKRSLFAFNSLLFLNLFFYYIFSFTIYHYNLSLLTILLAIVISNLIYLNIPNLYYRD